MGRAGSGEGGGSGVRLGWAGVNLGIFAPLTVIRDHFEVIELLRDGRA